MSTLTYTGTMEIHSCPSCHMDYAAPEAFFRRISEGGGSWYCPQGHSVEFTTSHAEEMRKLQQQLDRQKSRTRHLEDQYEAAQLSARSYKGHVTRIKNRIANGVCPFCNRSFENVRNHMKSEHPKEPVPAE